MSDYPEQLLPDYWWCAFHKEVHRGPIESWGMEHRMDLHPVFAKIRPVESDRLSGLVPGGSCREQPSR